MDVSIIIVNWNSTEFIKQCIHSIQSTVSSLEYEIIVVDNASVDFACRTLSEAFPSVKLVCLDSNLGFARANNIGAEHSRGKKLLFLNPDTLVLGDAIERMAHQLDSNCRAGAVGCRLLNSDLTLQTSSVQPFPTILNQLLSMDWLKRHWPKLPLWGMQALYTDGCSVVDVEVVSGACIMVQSLVFESVGLFSTEYFMYAEEADLCYKIWRAGWRVCHVAEAEVIHFGGQSAKKRGNDFSNAVMRESVFKLLSKFRGIKYAYVYRAALCVSAIVRLAILSPLFAIPNRLLNRDVVASTFGKWRTIAAWSLAIGKGHRNVGPQVDSALR